MRQNSQSIGQVVRSFQGCCWLDRINVAPEMTASTTPNPDGWQLTDFYLLTIHFRPYQHPTPGTPHDSLKGTTTIGMYYYYPEKFLVLGRSVSVP
jgi:hypothetical protein